MMGKIQSSCGYDKFDKRIQSVEFEEESIKVEYVETLWRQYPYENAYLSTEDEIVNHKYEDLLFDFVEEEVDGED